MPLGAVAPGAVGVDFGSLGLPGEAIGFVDVPVGLPAPVPLAPAVPLACGAVVPVGVPPVAEPVDVDPVTEPVEDAAGASGVFEAVSPVVPDFEQPKAKARARIVR